MSADWKDIFANPDSWVPVEFVPPAHTAQLIRRGGSGVSTCSDEVLSLDVDELGPGAAGAWARDGGWPAFGTRVRALAAVLGGACEQQTFATRRRGAVIAERHEVRYVGPPKEL